jgi:hypothetical protein
LWRIFARWPGVPRADRAYRADAVSLRTATTWRPLVGSRTSAVAGAFSGIRRGPVSAIIAALSSRPSMTDSAPRRSAPVTAARSARWLQLQGIGLFVFIPLVLYLLVRHPAPILASAAVALVVMFAHRLVAQPYAARVLPFKCIWCNRVLPPALDSSSRTIDLAAGGQVLPVRVCAEHHRPASRFFRFLWAGRRPFSVGIFVPLLALVAALGAAAAGRALGALPLATALFQLTVGLTVNVVALGPWLGDRVGNPSPIPVPFPLHNFYLLGVRALLWLFRVIGIWWILLVCLQPFPSWGS